MDSIHLESIHMPTDFQYAEAVRNIAQKYLELINTQDKDGFIEQVQIVSKHMEAPRGNVLLFFCLVFMRSGLYFLVKSFDKPSYSM